MKRKVQNNTPIAAEVLEVRQLLSAVNEAPSFDLANDDIQPTIKGGLQTVPNFAKNIWTGGQADTKHYSIPVGKNYTGIMPYLAFVSDQDSVGNALADSKFSNVSIVETNTGVRTPINFNTMPPSDYANSSNGPGKVEVLDDGTTLHLVGNRWQKINLPGGYNVTRYTVLEFDFSCQFKGENHGIGFSQSDAADNRRIYQVYGNEIWGQKGYNNYLPGGESGQTISFNVTTNKPELFSQQPAIDSAGTLTYTPAAGAENYATVIVKATDSLGAESQIKEFDIVFTVDTENKLPTVSHHNIPDFSAEATVTSIANGNWNNPDIWSNGVVPQGNDIVVITAGTNVVLDQDAEVYALGVHGKLIQSNTLSVKDYIIHEDGQVDFLPGSRTIFRDIEIDIANDPEQYGTGLIILGEINVLGSQKESFVRTKYEPKAGDTLIKLEHAGQGWKIGDKIVFPDTRQLNGDTVGDQSETRYIVGFNSGGGDVLIINEPLKYNHNGAKNAAGIIEFMPHVMNITRDVVFESENPDGTRGHILATHAAIVNMRYGQYDNLGRTTINAADNTIFNSEGDVIHIGQNQVGRYPIHMHHLHGPTSHGEHVDSQEYYVYELVGNTVNGGDADNIHRWGITIHQSHFGLIKDNNVYNYAGAGIATEDGNEYHNVIEHNAVFRTDGVGKITEHDPRDTGNGGYGFWFRGPHNYVRDNISAGSFRTAFYQFSRSRSNSLASERHIPEYPGQPVAEYILGPPLTTTPFLEFSNNEAYGSHEGVQFYRGNGENPDAEPSLIKDMIIWNTTWGIQPKYDMDLIIDGWTQIGDINEVGDTKYPAIGIYGSLDYTDEFVLSNVRIENMDVGILHDGGKFGSNMEVNGAILKNIVNVKITVGGTDTQFYDRKQTIFRDFVFDNPFGRNTLLNVQMDGSKLSPDDFPLTLAILRFENYNNTGEDFQMYYNEQKPDYILPNNTRIPTHLRGLTNQQAWDTYGQAFAGEIVPNEAVIKELVQGMVLLLPSVDEVFIEGIF